MDLSRAFDNLTKRQNWFSNNSKISFTISSKIDRYINRKTFHNFLTDLSHMGFLKKYKRISSLLYEFIIEYNYRRRLPMQKY